MTSVDLQRELATLYRVGRDPVIVDVPDLTCLMVDGRGDPNTSVDYRDAVEALFTLSWTIRFALKRQGVLDYKVMPLEGRWWMPDMADFATSDKSSWFWTALIVQPDVVGASALAEACDATRDKELPALDAVRLERWTEGRSAQVLHVGPYSEEAPTIAALHAFIERKGLELTGKHHEIYLGDPRRAAPEKLRTIIRQPVGEPGTA
jgi:hypothetical protein